MTDEREAHEAFEELVGGPDKGFKLMRLWGHSFEQDYQWGRHTRKSKRDVFADKAEWAGFTEEQVEAFLDLQ